MKSAQHNERLIAVIANSFDNFVEWMRAVSITMSYKGAFDSDGNTYIYVDREDKCYGVTYDSLIDISNPDMLSLKRRIDIENVKRIILSRIKRAKRSIKTINTKSIRIAPSVWYLDVLEGEYDNRMKYLNDNYETEDFIPLDREGDFVTCLYSKNRDDNQYRLILSIDSVEDHITVVHEIVHIIHTWAKETMTDLSYDSQEWQALLSEYLFEKITSKDDYKKVII
jgi:hypothetical protein